jgi:methylenetetrahydrofolate--tRNA-(uracil-5-)-methyltransferase
MRPIKMTPAHKTEKFGELVCSNSLRSDMLDVASGALKREMELFNSLVIKAAYETRVEAGSALAVSREDFSQYITNVIKNHENIEVIYEEVTTIDMSKPTIIASGPLTSLPLCDFIKKEFGMDDFYFFDAQAPIVKAETINMDIEVFGDFKIQVNDYVYMLEDTTKETITVRFGAVITDKTEIIKIVRGEESYYLQRYYG